MGDRAYMELRCLKKDVPAFEDIGFKVDDTNSGDPPDMVRMVDEEANYGHCDDMRCLDAGIPFIAWHGEGDCYGSAEYCSDGKRFGEMSMDRDGEYVVPVDPETGMVREGCLAGAVEYIKLRRKAKEALGYPPEEPKKRKGRRGR